MDNMAKNEKKISSEHVSKPADTKPKTVIKTKKGKNPRKVVKVKCKPVADMAGSKKNIEEEDKPMTNAKRKTDCRASVEEVEQPLTSQSKPTRTDPQNWISKFCDIFPDSQNAFNDNFLKKGPLSIDKAKIWDEQLTSFIKYNPAIRNNPKHKFSTPTLWPKAATINALQRTLNHTFNAHCCCTFYQAFLYAQNQ